MGQLLRVSKDWAEVRERNNVLTKQAPKVCWLVAVMSYKQLQVNYSLVRTSVSLWTAQKVGPTAWKVEPAGCTYAHALPRKLGCSFVKLIRKMFFFWQLTDFIYPPKYQSQHMPNYFMNYVALSQTSSGSQALLSVFTPPLPGAEGNTPCHRSYLAHTSLFLWGVVLIFPSVGGPSQSVLDQYHGTPSLTLMIFENAS